MADEDVRIRVPKQEGLLLRALALTKGMGCNEFLTSLIRTEARKQGVDPVVASQVVESSRAPAPEIVVKLRTERIRRGLTQEALARLFNLTQSNLASIENGKRPLPQRLLEAVLTWLRDTPSQPPPSSPPQLHGE